MVKEPHFTPQKMLAMLGLQADSLGPYALDSWTEGAQSNAARPARQPSQEFYFLGL